MGDRAFHNARRRDLRQGAGAKGMDCRGFGVGLKAAVWLGLSGLLFAWAALALFDGLWVLALLLGGAATTALFAAYRN